MRNTPVTRAARFLSEHLTHQRVAKQALSKRGMRVASEKGEGTSRVASTRGMRAEG